MKVKQQLVLSLTKVNGRTPVGFFGEIRFRNTATHISPVRFLPAD